MPAIQRALLFINLYKERAPALARELSAELLNVGIEPVPFEIADNLFYFEARHTYDIAFSLGGDGTVLYVARAMAPLGVPIFPINLGTLGFIAAVDADEWGAVFKRWMAGDVRMSRRLMLEARVERVGSVVFEGSCLNDVVISASGIAKPIRLQVEMKTPHEYIYLGKYHSDGLIVATPTGSTAYSVASGGPIVDPELEALIISPICSFSLAQRPVVVPARETILVKVEEEQRSGVLLTLDGQVAEPLKNGDCVYIRQAPYQAKLIASDRDVFYRALRTKLSWGG